MDNREAIKRLTAIVKTMAERLIQDIDPATDETGIYGEKCEWCHQVTSASTHILHEMDCPIHQTTALLTALEDDETEEGSINE